MCTAIVFGDKNRYFGRTLDLEYRLDESVIITPRQYRVLYKCADSKTTRYAIMGVGIIRDDYPLYYDATNERGVSIAGLNFVNNAYYHQVINSKLNLAPYELIPYLLGRYSTVDECLEELSKINLIDAPFNDELQSAQLHWIISDKDKSITLECTKQGMNIYHNSVGVLTNNPHFDFQMWNLSNYINLTSEEAVNRFSSGVDLKSYSRGMGAIGLPGDLSSASRFVRVCFTKFNAVLPKDDAEQVAQFFHVLGSVEQQEGSVRVVDGYERTQYTSCCDTEKMIYYYTTYENTQIRAVRLTDECASSDRLIEYKMSFSPSIDFIN